MNSACRPLAICSFATLCVAFDGTIVSRLHAQEAVRVSPLFGASQVYDSNLFSSSGTRAADLVTRISPGVEGVHRSSLVTVVGRYVIDLERFASHPELTTANGGQQGSINLGYSPSRRLAVSMDVAHARTNTPGELAVGTGLTLARAAAQRLEAHPKIVWHLEPTARVALGYTWSDERLVGRVASRTHRIAASADRQVSRRDTISVNYDIRTFVFGTNAPLISHSGGLGWSRLITRQSSVELRGGPAMTASVLRPDLFASMRYRPRAAELSMTYARTQTTVIGHEGIVDTQSLTGVVAYTPRPLQIRMVPGVFLTTLAGRQATAIRLAFEAERPVTEWLSVRAMYEGTSQRGRITAASGSLSRHLVQVSAAMASPLARGARRR